MKKLIILFGLVLMFSSLVHAQLSDGNELYKKYQSALRVMAETSDSNDVYDAFFYAGWIQGTLESFRYLKIFTNPAGLTYNQYGDILGKYLKDHPESRHKEGITLFLEALVVSFPGKVNLDILEVVTNE